MDEEMFLRCKIAKAEVMHMFGSCAIRVIIFEMKSATAEL